LGAEADISCQRKFAEETLASTDLMEGDLCPKGEVLAAVYWRQLCPRKPPSARRRFMTHMRHSPQGKWPKVVAKFLIQLIASVFGEALPPAFIYR